MTSAEGLRVPGSDMMGLGSRFVFDCRVWGVRRQVPLSGCVECSGFSIPSGSLRPYRTTMAEWNLGQITIVSGRRYDLSSVPENRGDRLGFLHLRMQRRMAPYAPAPFWRALVSGTGLGG